jgi:hypothetical protein
MSRSTPRRPVPSRRRFLQTLGAATAAVPLGLAWPALAQTPPPAPPATPPPAPAPEGDPGLQADAQHLVQIVERRWGERLDAAQLEAVRDDVQGLLGAGAALRRLELRNADEPDVVFRAAIPEA